LKVYENIYLMYLLLFRYMLKEIIGDKTFIVAEISGNHNNDFELTKKTIKAIADSGADAVKVQTYTADSLTMNANTEYFGQRKDGLWKGRTLFEIYTEGSMPWEWQPKLKNYTEDLGLFFFSSPFDYKAVDFLESIDIKAYKIASLEITDIPLIKYIAEKGKPIILSTGVATLADIELAIRTCHGVGNHDIALLKCTSAYPTPYSEVNLRSMNILQHLFKTVVGLSDHTLGSTVAIGSVALGAKIVEKHFILDRSLGGTDAAFSMEPDEFTEMVKSIRIIEESLGDVNFELTDKMKDSRTRARSIFISKDIKKGEEFTTENIRTVRPNDGLHPKYLSEILGKQASKDLKMGYPLKWEFIS
jgi:pseudaminic acid synthase